MLVKQVDSPTKLNVIREIDEYPCSCESKLKFREKRVQSTHASSIAASTNLYSQEFLERDSCEIVREYRNNPFFRAKLSYTLTSYIKNKRNFQQNNEFSDHQEAISTHKHTNLSAKKLIHDKIMEILQKIEETVK